MERRRSLCSWLGGVEQSMCVLAYACVHVHSLTARGKAPFPEDPYGMPSGEKKNSPSVICQYTHLSEQLLSHMRRPRESVVLLTPPSSSFSFKGE